MVRIGELAATRRGGEVLTSIGLGSCVGLALLDAGRAVSGLAHVMLPEAPAGAHLPPGKFADTAVPELLRRVTDAGARRHALEAVLVGGASMFSFKSAAGMDIGPRNESAIRGALAVLGIPVAATDLGGSRGRTVEVFPHGMVVVKQAGQDERLLHGAAREMVA